MNTGNPVQPGLYACEVFYGWKLLHWDGAVWWFELKVGKWGGNTPAQWVGPLPDRVLGLSRIDNKPVMEFDL